MSLVHFATNLEDLAEGIGHYMGMGVGISQRDYMDTLITQAFDVAEAKFNNDAGLSAKAWNFEHMYEFYTQKVHDNGTLDPDSQGSRLWVNTLTGGGGRKRISFEFLPAKKPRTEITSEETGGIDEDIIKKLKVNNGTKYYWPTKAMDTEENKAIHLKPREEKGILLIPTIQGLNNATAKEEKQKFGLRTKYTNLPGEWTGGGGAFTSFFWEYWQEKGAVSMNDAMVDKFNSDIIGFEKYLKVNPSAPKPTRSTNVAAVVEEAKRKTQKQWTIWARDEAGDYKVIT